MEKQKETEGEKEREQLHNGQEVCGGVFIVGRFRGRMSHLPLRIRPGAVQHQYLRSPVGIDGRR
jgi:hypothetical protein